MDPGVRPSLVRPLFIIALLWGVLLNGFFLYLPYLADLDQSKDPYLISGLGWLGFCLVALAVGMNYWRFSGRKQGAVAGLLVIVILAVIPFFGESLGPWAWIPVGLSLSLTLSLMVSRVVSRTYEVSVAKVSAWLGATPLIGLLVMSVPFSLPVVRQWYSLLAAVLTIVALMIFVVESDRQDLHHGEYSTIHISPVTLLGYGFLLSMGVALVNSHVYARVAEVTDGGSERSAVVGAGLVFLSSIVGVVASVVVGARFFERQSHVVLVRIAGGIVSIGIVVLLIAHNILVMAIAGLMVGVGFGFANGLELRLVQDASGGPRQRTALFGAFLAATTVPYVAASMLGLLFATWNIGTIPALAGALVAAVSSTLVIRAASPRPS